LHALLIAKDHQSTVAFGRDIPINCNSAMRIGSRISIYMHVARTRLFDSHCFGSAEATEAFILKISSLNPDVIHLHNLHGYYLHIGLLFEYLKKAKIPVIWTLHDCWAFTGHCSYFDFIGCTRWMSECYDCPNKTEYPKSLFFDRSKQNFHQKKELFTGINNLVIVTPSKWLAHLVNESFLQEYPVKIMNNGVDLEMFKPTPSDFRERYGLKDQFILLGVASIWSERKGFQYFIALAKQLLSDAKIVLVGLNDRQIKQLPTGIIGIEKTNRTEELAEIYSSSDLFINPTLEDNFPTTNIEALACGTPVITFDTGGSPECLDEGCGLVVQRGDFSGLVEAIAIVRKKGKNFYTERCQKRVKDLFDKNDRFAEYVALYEGYMNIDGKIIK
jgi:putative colanic acid biosynthesis glycosyltransferase